MMRKLLGRCLYPVLMAAILSIECTDLSAQGSSLDQKAREESKKERLEALEKAPRSLKPKFRGYGQEKKLFDRMCESLDKDARRERLYQLAAGQNEKQPDCVACQPFFRQLALSCKAKRSKKQITPKPAQREPHMEVLISTTNLMRALAEGNTRLETISALDKLLFILRSTTLFEPGEGEYFELLADYMDAPFQAARREKLAQESSGEGAHGHEISESEKQEALENLF